MAQILVIDDNEILLQVVSEMLAKAGHQVESLNAPEALEVKLRKTDFDLVITDIIMPNKEGFEIIMHVRDEHPNIKILAMSGRDLSGTLNVLELAATIGADSTIKKPFGYDEIIDAVDTVLS